MSYFSSKTRLAFIVFSTFTAGVCLLFTYVLWSTSTVVNGEIVSSQLNERVTIERDEHGIPTITANNDHDMFFAQGYVHAQDRLFQMILYKHMFSGRMSELVGERAIRLDQYMRTLRVKNVVDDSYPYLKSQTRQAIESYAGGVNQYISENKKSIEMYLLGYELEPWDPKDTLIVQKAIAFDLSRHWPRIIRNTALAHKLGLKALDRYYPQIDLEEPSVTDEDLQKGNLPFDIKPHRMLSLHSTLLCRTPYQNMFFLLSLHL